MATYIVHMPQMADSKARPISDMPEKIVFLRDGFCVPAFVFGPFWFFWSGAWVIGLFWGGVIIVSPALAWALHLPEEFMVWFALSLALWQGFEGRRLLAWSLLRKGFVEEDIVVSETEEEAEEVFFARWHASPSSPNDWRMDA